MLSFDTNVLVYAADRTAGIRHAAAVKLLSVAASGAAVLNEQSVMEFLNVATRKQKQPLGEAANLVQSWLRNFPLITAAETVFEGTMALLNSYSLSIWDAHMLAICGSNGCNALLSEDLADGAWYDKVRVLNPFNAANTQIVAEMLES